MHGLLKKYDHWSAERISRHLLYWTFWVLFYVCVNYFTKGMHSFGQWLGFELVVVPIKVGCAYTIAYFLMPRFLYRQQYLAFLLTSVVVAFAFGVVLFYAYAYIIFPGILKLEKTVHFLNSFIYKGLDLVHITSLVLCVKFFQNLLHQENVSNQLQAEKVSAELKYLKNQVQPHFLFNTLNNLYGQVLSGDDRAPKTIVKLSDMLSYMLYGSQKHLVFLEEEVAHLNNYIGLERLRYDRKLDLHYEPVELPAGQLIAPLLLQPFVENAFKHGPAKEEGRSKMWIDLWLEDTTLHFSIKNTFVDCAEEMELTSGIGLDNVRKRLDLLYPGRYTLDFVKDELFEVYLTLELQTADEE